jgi:hypothetical protein
LHGETQFFHCMRGRKKILRKEGKEHDKKPFTPDQQIGSEGLVSGR